MTRHEVVETISLAGKMGRNVTNYNNDRKLLVNNLSLDNYEYELHKYLHPYSPDEQQGTLPTEIVSEKKNKFL